MKSTEVEILEARSVDTTWQIVSCVCELVGTKVVTVTEQPIAATARRDKVMAVLGQAASERRVMYVSPLVGDTQFDVCCPAHGVIRRNTTIADARETAYTHSATIPHDQRPRTPASREAVRLPWMLHLQDTESVARQPIEAPPTVGE